MNDKRSGLVLTRKIGQSVMIQTKDGEVEITLTKRQGNYVKILFQVPAGVTVLRKELCEKQTKRNDDVDEQRLGNPQAPIRPIER